MSSIVFLMHVERRRREIGIVTLVAQSVILPFAPRCGYLEGLTGLLVAGLISLPLIVNFDDQARPLGILDWCGQQIGSHWGMMTGMLVGNFVGIGAFDTLRKLNRHPDFGREKA